MRRLVAIVALALALPSSAPAQRVAAAPAAVPAPAEVRSGVTTHFSQGWPPRLMDDAAALGVTTIRDSLHWAQVEKASGVYTFTAANSGHVQRACNAGATVLLGIDPRNKIYDNGNTAFSPAARAAFADYVLAIADRYPGCVVAIEVGNEINIKAMVTGAAAANPAASHTALLRSIHERVKPRHPGLAILGGSTNTIAVGFLAKLFAAGALAYMDGVVVHPYRDDPEGVDRDLARLQAAMARAGTIRPIWATEFSREFATPAAAPAYLLKMTALMESAGVGDHFWYALIDQKWFPTMGLLTTQGAAKPASRAFAFAARELAPLGPASRVDHDDPTLFHFRYGPTTHVVWGARRTLTAGAGARFFRADGTAMAAPAAVSDDPVVITGAPDLAFGPGQVLADSLYGYGQEPLRWLARRQATGREFVLQPVDWQWSTYLGERTMPQMMVNPRGLGPTTKTEVVVRYTADRAGAFVASFCLLPLGTTGDGVTATLTARGGTLVTEQVGPLTGARSASARVRLTPGDVVELVVAPKANPAGDRMKYRFRIARGEADAASC